MDRQDTRLSGASPLAALRLELAGLEGFKPAANNTVLPFGIPEIDMHLPDSGVMRGALHEVAGSGPDTEFGCAASWLIAGLLAQCSGSVLWVVRRRDLFAPALLQVGVATHRLVFVEAGNHALLAMEEGLRHRSLAAVVGECDGRVSLTASRRLQLAAELSGVTCFLLRRSRRFDDPMLCEPNAALTRWRIAGIPTPPSLHDRPRRAWIDRRCWRLDLIRCRGGNPGSWLVENSDASNRFSLSAILPDGSLAAQRAGRMAG